MTSDILELLHYRCSQTQAKPYTLQSRVAVCFKTLLLRLTHKLSIGCPCPCKLDIAVQSPPKELFPNKEY